MTPARRITPTGTRLEAVRDEDVGDEETPWERMLRLDVVLPPPARIAEVSGQVVPVERDPRPEPSGLRFKFIERPPRVAEVGDARLTVEWKRKLKVRCPAPRDLPFAFDRPRKLTVYGSRPRSIGNGRLTRKERAELKELTTSLGKGHAYKRKPKTYGDCSADPRPCPWVRCRHHLYLEVDEETGVIKMNFPGLDVGDLEQTCSLKAAAEGSTDGGYYGKGHTLERTGELVNLTLERTRQIVRDAIASAKRGYRRRGGDDDGD